MAREQNFTISQNETLLKTVTVTNMDGTPFNLTDFEAIAFMKRNYDSVSYQDLHPIIDSDPTTGVITLNLIYLETAALTVGRYVYDLFIRNPGTGFAEKIVYGIIDVFPAIATA